MADTRRTISPRGSRPGQRVPRPRNGPQNQGQGLRQNGYYCATRRECVLVPKCNTATCERQAYVLTYIGVDVIGSLVERRRSVFVPCVQSLRLCGLLVNAIPVYVYALTGVYSFNSSKPKLYESTTLRDTFPTSEEGKGFSVKRGPDRWCVFTQ